MRLLVTGRDGQVVRSLVERAGALADVTVIPIGRPELDLARPETVAAALDGQDADVIVSAAMSSCAPFGFTVPSAAIGVNRLS